MLFNTTEEIEILTERYRRESADLLQYLPAKEEGTADVTAVEMDLFGWIGHIHYILFLFGTDQCHAAVEKIDLRMVLQETNAMLKMAGSKFII